MKTYSGFLKQVTTKLGKRELMLSLILLDLCTKPENIIDKFTLSHHPCMSNSLLNYLTPSINKIVNTPIILNHKDDQEPTGILFEEITRENFHFKVKLNESILNTFKRSGVINIEDSFFYHFTALSDIRFVLWFKTWENKKQETISIDALRRCLNKQFDARELFQLYIKPIIKELVKFGVIIKIEKIKNKNDMRYISDIVFKLGN